MIEDVQLEAAKILANFYRLYKDINVSGIVLAEEVRLELDENFRFVKMVHNLTGILMLAFDNEIGIDDLYQFKYKKGQVRSSTPDDLNYKKSKDGCSGFIYDIKDANLEYDKADDLSLVELAINLGDWISVNEFFKNRVGTKNLKKASHSVYWIFAQKIAELILLELKFNERLSDEVYDKEIEKMKSNSDNPVVLFNSFFGIHKLPEMGAEIDDLGCLGKTRMAKCMTVIKNVIEAEQEVFEVYQEFLENCNNGDIVGAEKCLNQYDELIKNTFADKNTDYLHKRLEGARFDLKKGIYEERTEVFERGKHLLKEGEKLYFDGKIEEAYKKFREAEGFFIKYIEKDATFAKRYSASGYGSLGEIYEYLKEYDKARDCYQNAIAKGNHRNSYYRLARFGIHDFVKLSNGGKKLEAKNKKAEVMDLLFKYSERTRWDNILITKLMMKYYKMTGDVEKYLDARKSCVRLEFLYNFKEKENDSLNEFFENEESSFVLPKSEEEIEQIIADLASECERDNMTPSDLKYYNILQKILHFIPEEEGINCDYVQATSTYLEEVVGHSMADGSVVKRDKDVVRAFETVSLLQEAARLIAYYKFKKNFKSYDLVGAKEALAEYEAAVLGIYGEKSSKQYHDRITAMEKAMKASNFYEKENLYTEAVEAYKMRGYNACIKKLTKYIEMDPNDSAKGYLYRASAYESVKMFDLALADYLQGLELAPEEGNTYFRVGQIYFRQKKKKRQ